MDVAHSGIYTVADEFGAEFHWVQLLLPLAVGVQGFSRSCTAPATFAPAVRSACSTPCRVASSPLTPSPPLPFGGDGDKFPLVPFLGRPAHPAGQVHLHAATTTRSSIKRVLYEDMYLLMKPVERQELLEKFASCSTGNHETIGQPLRFIFTAYFVDSTSRLH